MIINAERLGVIHIYSTERLRRSVYVRTMSATVITVLLVAAVLASAAASALMYVRIESLREEMERLKPKTVTSEEMDKIEESLKGFDSLPSD